MIFPSIKIWLSFSLLSFLKKILLGIGETGRRNLSLFVGKLFFFILKKRKEDVLNNLKIAFPDKGEYWRKRICYKTYLHFSQVFLDFLPLYFASDKWIKGKIVINNLDIVKDLTTDTGCVIVGFHFGNWEIIPEVLVRRRFNLASVAKSLKNRAIDGIVRDIRTRNGMKIIDMNDSVLKMVSHVKRGGILYIVPDQYAGRRGRDLDFFGIKTKVFIGPSRLSLKLNVPMILATCNLVNGKYYVNFDALKFDKHDYSEENVLKLTGIYFRYYEEKICKNPEQYFWFHRRWKKR